MANPPDRPDHAPSRRALLRSGLVAGAAALGGKAAAQGNPANQPPNVPDWSKYLGDGVAVRAYGKPSQHEAHVVRRDVEWLTASKESSVSFTPLHALDGMITPNGLCFERHHAGIAEIDPADYRLILHGLVDKPLIFTLDDLKRFPRVNRAYFCECAANSGMEWRGAHDALAAAGEGARRRARRVSHERRDAAPRERLSGPHRAPGLGGEHVDQMAAPDRGRRRALAPPRGDLEIHRPPRERPGAALHLCHGREIGDHEPEPAGAAQPPPRPDDLVRPRLVRPGPSLARRRLA